MKFFLYSSPYKYYEENLTPIGHRLIELGHDIVQYSDIDGEKLINSTFRHQAFPTKEIDCVILTQSWWLKDELIANWCVDNKVPFYIVEHAPQMLHYMDVAYRKTLNGARAHFMWGRESASIMGFNTGNILPVVGAPRLEKTNLKGALYIKNRYSMDKPIAVVYTTGKKMMQDNFDDKLKLVKESLKDHTVIIKDHVKYSSKNSWKEKDLDLELIIASDKLFFAFPSSVMIPAFMYGKKCYSLYHDHHNENVKQYSKLHSDIICEFNGDSNFTPNGKKYKEFLSRNYAGKGSVDKIINYILNSL